MWTCLRSNSLRLCLVLLILFLWLGYETFRAVGESKVPFLWPYSGAQWVVCPTSGLSHALPGISLDAEFTREFELKDKPQSATIQVRMFKHGTLWINNRQVLRTTHGSDWKSVSRIVLNDGVLISGHNQIRMVIENDAGPPALWFRMDVNGLACLATGEEPGVNQWRVEQAGGTRVDVVPVSTPMPMDPNDGLDIGTDLSGAFNRSWRVIVFCLALSGILVTVLSAYMRPKSTAVAPWDVPDSAVLEKRERRVAFLIVGLFIALWIGIGVHNATLINSRAGFDAGAHLEYIEYVRKTGKMLSADRGWAGYQAPLYYFLNAGVLKVLGVETNSATGIFVVRMVNVALGLVMLFFLGLSLRLLFPENRRCQFLGLLFATFLPLNLYDQQYPSNASLLVVMVAAAFYATVRIVRSTSVRAVDVLLLGGCLGLGMISKVSMLVMIPTCVGAMVWRAMKSDAGPGMESELGKTSGASEVLSPSVGMAVRMRRTGWLVGLVMIVISGIALPFYGRVWQQFGSPFVSNFSPETGWRFWQRPGYVTWSQFGSFGSSVTSPLTWVYGSVWNQFYGSFWSDANLGEAPDLLRGGYWNLDLLVMGPTMGLMITLAMVVGVWICVRRFVVKADVAMVLPPLMVFLSLALVIHLYLQYGQLAFIKSQYALTGIAGFTVIVAVGLDWAAGTSKTKIGRVRRFVVLTLVVAWAMVSYVTYFVDPDSKGCKVAQALEMIDNGKPEQAAGLLEPLLNDSSKNWAVKSVYVQTTERLVPPAQRARCLGVLGAFDGPAKIKLQYAMTEFSIGQVQRGTEHLEMVVREHPEFMFEAGSPLAWIYWKSGNTEQAIVAGRRVLLEQPLDPYSHLLLSLAYQKLGDPVKAEYHADYHRRITLDQQQRDWQGKIDRMGTRPETGPGPGAGR